jgi:hypothetical protein
VEPPVRRISRRWFLAGGGAVLVGAGGGVAAEFAHTGSAARLARPPAALIAAADAERSLIGDLDATTGGSAAVRSVVEQVRADHAAHLAAITDLLTKYRTPAASPSTPSVPVHGTPRTLAQLRSAEQRASASAAARASALDAATATLLACISACEATHAELLR